MFPSTAFVRLPSAIARISQSKRRSKPRCPSAAAASRKNDAGVTNLIPPLHGEGKLLRGDQLGGAAIGAVLEVDLLQVADALGGDVVARHAGPLGLQLVHVDVGRIERPGALGGQPGVEERLD